MLVTTSSPHDVIDWFQERDEQHEIMCMVFLSALKLTDIAYVG
jgi:hypothetical protein